jgi:hypothetical protein
MVILPSKLLRLLTRLPVSAALFLLPPHLSAVYFFYDSNVQLSLTCTSAMHHKSRLVGKIS